MNHIPKTITQQRWSYTKILILLISCIFFIRTEHVNASHLIGGQIAYECLGNNQYRVNLTLYRDCSGIAMETSQYLSINSASCGLSLSNVVLSLDTFFEISNCPLSSTCNGGTSPGTEQYVYSAIIALPQTCTDWVLSWSNCCRNTAITNLATSVGAGNVYLEAGINSSLCNDSPIFTTERLNYFCAGQCYEHNAGAYDPEGDSLLFALTCPQGGVGLCISNVPGLSPTQPLFTSPSNSFNFDSNTGQMSFCPIAGQTQIAATVITVYQILNGDTIGYVQRDIQLTVINSVNCTCACCYDGARCCHRRNI